MVSKVEGDRGAGGVQEAGGERTGSGKSVPFHPANCFCSCF